MKLIHSEPSLGGCDMKKSILEAHGIPCILKNEQGSLTAGAGYPTAAGPSLSFAWPEIWIEKDEQYEEAQRILQHEG